MSSTGRDDAQDAWWSGGPVPGTLASLFALLLVAAALQLARLHYFSKPWTSQKTLHVLVGGAAGVRAGFFFASSSMAGPLVWGGVVRSHFPSTALYVADQAPGLLAFAAVLVLLLLWVDIVHAAAEYPRAAGYEAARGALAAVAVAVGTGQVALWANYGNGTPATDADLSLASAILAVVAFACAGLGFVCYGGALRRQLASVPVALAVRRGKLREVRNTTAVVAAAFLLRAAAVAVAEVATRDGWGIATDQISSGTALALVGYFLLLEAAPLATMLWCVAAGCVGSRRLALLASLCLALSRFASLCFALHRGAPCCSALCVDPHPARARPFAGTTGASRRASCGPRAASPPRRRRPRARRRRVSAPRWPPRAPRAAAAAAATAAPRATRA